MRPHLDTPSQHIDNGKKLLDRGKADDAYREFARARELDPSSAQALAGLAMALVQQGDLQTALKYLNEAEKLAADSQDHAYIQKGYDLYDEALGAEPTGQPVR
jgi:Flp pilus assembly protein TadD